MLMDFLYYSFDVLIIQDIPEHVTYRGVHLHYLDKGWCWAESSIARLCGKLVNLSPAILEDLDQEEKERSKHTMSLIEALRGYETYPTHLLAHGCAASLLVFREMQSVKGKVFTNGKHDADTVSQILCAMQATQKLRKLIEAGERDEVIRLVESNREVTRSWSVGSVLDVDLVNVVFDDTFTTPLHLAVRLGDVHLIEYLVHAGARPARDFYGCLPGEHFAFGLGCGSAARAVYKAMTEREEVLRTNVGLELQPRAA